MTKDAIDEESKILEERETNPKHNMEFALSLNDPIEKVFYKQPVLINEDTKIIEVINLFNDKDVGCVLVVNKENGKLIGIFTERDVIRKLLNKVHDLSKEEIGQYMTKRPDALYPSDPIAYALNRFATCGYRHIPLVDENDIPVGFLSIKDIIEHLVDYYSNEILNLPPSPHAIQKTREGG